MKAINVMFVCHGNICRSPMAEFIFKDMLKKRRLDGQFNVASSAVSFEEIGNPVYPQARNALACHGIYCGAKTAVHFEKDDYFKYNYIAVMDKSNMRNILRITGGKNDGRIKPLMYYVTGTDTDVSDPWYTGDFETAFCDIFSGCEALLDYILKAQG